MNIGSSRCTVLPWRRARKPPPIEGISIIHLIALHTTVCRRADIKLESFSACGTQPPAVSSENDFGSCEGNAAYRKRSLRRWRTCIVTT